MKRWHYWVAGVAALATLFTYPAVLTDDDGSRSVETPAEATAALAESFAFIDHVYIGGFSVSDFTPVEVD